MNKRHFIALALVAIVLVGLRLLVNHQGRRTASELSEAGLVRLVPGEIDPATITWVRITSPSSPSSQSTTAAATTPLRLERSEAGWAVASASGAPADTASVEAFIGKLLNLSGDLRGSGVVNEAEFGVDAPSATRVELGTAPGEPAVVMLIGKTGDDGDAHFAKLENAPSILHVQDGLRQDLDLRGESSSVAADHWVDKDILELAPADMTKAVFDRTDLLMVIEKGDSPDASGTVPWRVASPALPWPVQVDALDGLLSRAARIRVKSVLDASSAACMAEPSGTATFVRADGGSAIVRLLGALASEGGGFALSLEGRPHCYEMDSWGLQTLLPRASAAWTLPEPFEGLSPTAEPSRVKLDRATGSFIATRKGEQWSLLAPKGGKVDASRLDRLTSSLRFLRLEDLAEVARIAPALLQTRETVTMEIEGRTVGISFLGERPGAPGERYARIIGGVSLPAEWVLVVPKLTADSLLPALSEVRSPD